MKTLKAKLTKAGFEVKVIALKLPKKFLKVLLKRAEKDSLNDGYITEKEYRKYFVEKDTKNPKKS